MFLEVPRIHSPNPRVSQNTLTTPDWTLVQGRSWLHMHVCSVSMCSSCAVEACVAAFAARVFDACTVQHVRLGMCITCSSMSHPTPTPCPPPPCTHTHTSPSLCTACSVSGHAQCTPGTWAVVPHLQQSGRQHLVLLTCCPPPPTTPPVSPAVCQGPMTVLIFHLVILTNSPPPPVPLSSSPPPPPCAPAVCLGMPSAPLANGAWGPACNNQVVNTWCTGTCAEGFTGSPKGKSAF